LANCGNLKFPDFNFTDFGEKTQNFTDFGLKNWFWPCFTRYLSGKIFFTLILEAILRKNISPEKNFSSPPRSPTFLGQIRKKIWKNYGKIAKLWHRGNFRLKIVIFKTGCGNLP
jgi:hypothetical protein